MRVIAGTARRIPLKTPIGLQTRPTTDRIKETLFNMIQPYLCDCSFLDLFSGSGAIGIEALSRGANIAYFIEKDMHALGCIEENLKNTKLKEKAKVIKGDVIQGLQQIERNATVFQVVFMDPPYNCGFEKDILTYLKNTSLIDQDTLIIFEASLETDISYIEEIGFVVHKVKKYKTNKHVFVYQKETGM